jgi:Spx/MgsR family transcriptional regulator|tara:strand:- start:136 stop:477 length:342 start_codon:yes stop_codon:yes gene_type:complete
MKLYGIKNCDTVKKARKWLDENGVDYQFHDFKKDGLDDALLSRWEKTLGWEALINRRGTTWRKLPEEVRDTISAQTAHAIMLENPSIIKRPVAERGDDVRVGFSADEWSAWLS